MKTVDQIFQQLFETIEEWRPSEPEAKDVKEIIAGIQKDAFNEGWLQGLYRAQKEFFVGSHPWTMINSILSAAYCNVGRPKFPVEGPDFKPAS